MSEIAQLIVFRLDERRYALPLTVVEWVVRAVDVTRCDQRRLLCLCFHYVYKSAYCVHRNTTVTLWRHELWI